LTATRRRKRATTSSVAAQSLRRKERVNMEGLSKPFYALSAVERKAVLDAVVICEGRDRDELETELNLHAPEPPAGLNEGDGRADVTVRPSVDAGLKGLRHRLRSAPASLLIRRKPLLQRINPKA
jgi:hypothetical protein